MANVRDQIEELRKKLEKRYRDSTELFPDSSAVKEISVIPSNSTIINTVTGLNGFPRGRVTEIHGPYSSGKTTIAIELSVAAQQADSDAVVLFLDYEHAFDARYAYKLGLDQAPDRFVFAQPDYFEQGAAIVESFLEAGLVDLIVIDSIAAMTPKTELEGKWDVEGGTQKGLQANLMARFLEKTTKQICRGRKPVLILINQTRAFIDMSGRTRNAPKEVPAGGMALKFYTSIRLELEIVKSEGDELRGTRGTDQVYTQNRVRVTAVKNKLAPPFIRGTLVMEYGKGINNMISIAELAEVKLGIMSGAGYFKYDGDTPGTTFSCRGREAFQAHLETNPETLREIEAKTIAAIKKEHAVALGIEEIKVTGKAKELQGETMILTDEDQDKLPVEE